MRFRPCIDLRGGRVVQIVGGSLRDDAEGTVTNFETDRSPADYARLYREDGLTGGHVIALGPGNHEAALAALRANPGGLQMGGGITPENAREYLDAGASHVIVTSYVFREGRIDEERLKALLGAVGRDRLVLDLSCRRLDGEYRVVTDRWQTFTDVPVTRETLERLSESCAEFLVHGVDVEGLRLGIDTALVEMLGEGSPCPVTYAGGAHSLADLETVNACGKGRVDLTLGSALDIFGGDVPYRAVVEWDQQQRREAETERLTFREIRREELPLLWAIDRSEEVRHHHAVKDGKLVVRPDSFLIRGWPPGQQETETPKLFRYFDRGCWFFGAFNGEKLAGWTVLENQFLGGGGDRLQLKYLYVDRSYRGQGVGVRLFEAAQSKARERGAKRLYISATPSENTINFYLNRGCVLTPALDPELLALEPEDIHLECEV